MTQNGKESKQKTNKANTIESDNSNSNATIDRRLNVDLEAEKVASPHDLIRLLKRKKQENSTPQNTPKRKKFTSERELDDNDILDYDDEIDAEYQDMGDLDEEESQLTEEEEKSDLSDNEETITEVPADLEKLERKANNKVLKLSMEDYVGSLVAKELKSHRDAKKRSWSDEQPSKDEITVKIIKNLTQQLQATDKNSTEGEN